MLSGEPMLYLKTPGSTLEFIGNTFTDTKVGFVTKMIDGAGAIFEDNLFINNQAPDIYVEGLFTLVNIPIVRVSNFQY
jgi:hypothetical protein